jgi:hypothetical protein
MRGFISDSISSGALMDANHQQRAAFASLDCATPEFFSLLGRRSFLRFFLPLVPSKVEQFHHVPQWCYPRASLHVSTSSSSANLS